MRLPVRFSASLAAIAALALSAGTRAQAQSTASPTAGNGTYIAVDPLANVRYDNRFDLSLGMAYARIKAGPTLLHGANLGGLDLNGSYRFSKHWSLEGSGRAYLGSSGAGNTGGPLVIKGPFVAQYLFAAGPEWLGPHNKHGALIAHVLVGGAHFNSHLQGMPASDVDFYPNQFAPAAVFGGHIDLNRSARWVFRVTPDALYTRYGINYPPNGSYNNWNFGISVGVEYKFKKKR
jgi:hypothetical protein